MDHLRPTVFSAKNSKVDIIKTEIATIAFFSSPPFPLLAPQSFSPVLWFSFVTAILERLISGLRNLPFDAFSTSVRYTQTLSTFSIVKS